MAEHEEPRASQQEATQLRREIIRDLWNEPASLREIAAAVGSTPNSIGVEIHRMRADGWVLPYRYVKSSYRHSASVAA